MLNDQERATIEEAILILMKELHRTTGNSVNLHNTAEGLRMVLDPTYVGVF